MKNFTLVLCLCGLVSWGGAANAVSAGTVSASDASRNATGGIYTPSANGARGKQGLANAYKTNQRNTYYM